MAHLRSHLRLACFFAHFLLLHLSLPKAAAQREEPEHEPPISVLGSVGEVKGDSSSRRCPVTERRSRSPSPQLAQLTGARALVEIVVMWLLLACLL